EAVFTGVPARTAERHGSDEPMGWMLERVRRRIPQHDQVSVRRRQRAGVPTLGEPLDAVGDVLTSARIPAVDDELLALVAGAVVVGEIDDPVRFTTAQVHTDPPVVVRGQSEGTHLGPTGRVPSGRLPAQILIARRPSLRATRGSGRPQ